MVLEGQLLEGFTLDWLAACARLRHGSQRVAVEFLGARVPLAHRWLNLELGPFEIRFRNEERVRSGVFEISQLRPRVSRESAEWRLATLGVVTRWSLRSSSMDPGTQFRVAGGSTLLGETDFVRWQSLFPETSSAWRNQPRQLQQIVRLLPVSFRRFDERHDGSSWIAVLPRHGSEIMARWLGNPADIRLGVAAGPFQARAAFAVRGEGRSPSVLVLNPVSLDPWLFRAALSAAQAELLTIPPRVTASDRLLLFQPETSSSGPSGTIVHQPLPHVTAAELALEYPILEAHADHFRARIAGDAGRSTVSVWIEPIGPVKLLGYALDYQLAVEEPPAR